MKFEKEELSYGKISLQKSATSAVNSRQGQSKGSGGIIKGIGNDKDINNKIKRDLWNGGVKSITTYSISTIDTSQASDMELLAPAGGGDAPCQYFRVLPAGA